MAASDQETSSWILEFLLRQPIPNDLLHLILFALPLTTPPLPRLLKTLLLRRLAGDLASAIPSQTLDTLELIEQLDRDFNLDPSPSAALQLAYSAVGVDLTARFLKEEDGDLGDFFDAVNRVWNCRVGDLEGSEARGLVSGRLREERWVMEEAVVSGVVRGMLRMRETAVEAAEAVRDYLKEAAEKELGPTALEEGAAAVLGGDGERCEGFSPFGQDHSTLATCFPPFGRDHSTPASSRYSKLKKSFNLGARSLLTALSKEDVDKAFSAFTEAERGKLYRMFIQVIKSLHKNIEQEFVTICQETQVGVVLDTIEQVIEEQNLDIMSANRINVEDAKEKISQAMQD